jgi:hypothetical protein
MASDLRSPAFPGFLAQGAARPGALRSPRKLALNCSVPPFPTRSPAFPGTPVDHRSPFPLS